MFWGLLSIIGIVLFAIFNDWVYLASAGLFAIASSIILSGNYISVPFNKALKIFTNAYNKTFKN